jgi:dipeptidyl aminopeptidase/acylaminoacyl peptidase
MSRFSRGRVHASLFVVLALASAGTRAAAQTVAAPPAVKQPAAITAGGYVLPPAPVQELFRRDKNLAALDQLSPDGDHFAVPHFQELTDLQLMSRKTYRLAMLEFCPELNRDWRHCTYGNDGLQIFSLSTRRFVDVALPAGTFVSDLRWSPDGARLAFLAHLPAVSQVWIADARTGKAQAASDAPIMATLAARSGGGNPNAQDGDSAMLQWLPDGSLLTLIVPPGRGPEPADAGVPAGPLVRRTRDKATPTTTQPFLLKTPHDGVLFKHYTTAQLVAIAPGRAPRAIGAPAMYTQFSLSPDGRYILRETLEEPFSELVSYNQFGKRLEVIDLDGKLVAEVNRTPLRESSAIRQQDGAGNDRPREVAWRPDGKGLSLLWRESAKSDATNGDTAKAKDTGSTPSSRPAPGATSASTPAPATATASAAPKDRLMLLAPPFDPAKAQTLVSTEHRLSGARYSKDGHWAFATVAKRAENGRPALQDLVAWDLATAQPAAQPPAHVLRADIDPKDPLKLPGDLLTASSGNGVTWAIVSTDGAAAFLQGDGFKATFKPQPFVDRVTLRDGQTTRLFEGAADSFDKPLTPLDPDLNRLIVSRESKTMAPDSYLWTRAGGALDKLTANKDPYPEITGAQRVDFDFTRRDGLKVHARISLPVGYTPGTRVPAIFWDYPNEFGSPQEYERGAIQARNQNAYSRLSFLRWSDIWLTQGYALVYTDIPIIGANERFNDNYLPNLVDTMYAAMRKVDELGYVDIDRIGHGGHSYGAFTTANLLAHTPFFKAGIAGDGAYNRSLTPMTFQGERRNIWEAPTTYLEISPFFYADQINTPMLMYHGAQDNNSGTFLIQSERMIQALTGLGKEAVLYVYPFESHAPRAKENLLDLWARWIGWFDTYVKASGQPKAAAAPATAGR